MKNIIRAANEITADEYESSVFVIESDDQMVNGFWLMSESEPDYAEWYATREYAEERKAELTKFLVSQTFAIFGDPCEKIFETLSEAEEYAEKLADELAKYFVENSDHDENDDDHRCSSGTGFSNEVEFSENYCGEDFDTVRDAILDEAIEIKETE